MVFRLLAPAAVVRSARRKTDARCASSALVYRNSIPKDPSELTSLDGLGSQCTHKPIYSHPGNLARPQVPGPPVGGWVLQNREVILPVLRPLSTIGLIWIGSEFLVVWEFCFGLNYQMLTCSRPIYTIDFCKVLSIEKNSIEFYRNLQNSIEMCRTL